MIINSLVMDSGAHSLQHDDMMDLIENYSNNPNLKQINWYTYAELEGMRRKRARAKKHAFEFYKSKEFKEYLDEYARFIHKFGGILDWYINVDIIFNPEMSWEVQKYLENEHGLNPIPVIHHGTPLHWLEKYLDAGYELLGFGGLGRQVAWQKYSDWGDQAWSLVCPKPDRLPKVKIHGFAMTSFNLMRRYPWWSVDSASWAKLAAYGHLAVPYKRKGTFRCSEDPYIMTVSERSPRARLNREQRIEAKHYGPCGPIRKAVLRDWLEYIHVPFGKTDDDGNVKEAGVTNDYNQRNRANLLFFEAFRKALPEWPHPFIQTEEKRPTLLLE